MTVDAEALETLEAEREFLLRSLDDLDAELLAGNIDPDTYRVLHDDYTARASAVIRAIEAGTPRTAADGAARAPRALRVVTVAGIVVFAALAAVLLAKAVGQRSTGQTITGNAQTKSSPTSGGAADTVTSACNAAAAQPGSYAAQVNCARLLMGAGDYPDAVKQFVAASKLDPRQPEPFAYSGWITALVARQVDVKATKQQLVDAALTSIERAIAVAPSYPDAYVFKGVVLAQLAGKPCAGAAALQQFLANAPADHPMRGLVLSALADAVRAGKCAGLPSTPTTKP